MHSWLHQAFSPAAGVVPLGANSCAVYPEQAEAAPTLLQLPRTTNQQPTTPNKQTNHHGWVLVPLPRSNWPATRRTQCDRGKKKSHQREESKTEAERLTRGRDMGREERELGVWRWTGQRGGKGFRSLAQAATTVGCLLGLVFGEFCGFFGLALVFCSGADVLTAFLFSILPDSLCTNAI